MKLLVLGALSIIVLFFAGLVAPRRSRKLEMSLAKGSRKAERGGSEHGGRGGDWTAASLRRVRRAGEASADLGRRLNRKIRAFFRALAH